MRRIGLLFLLFVGGCSATPPTTEAVSGPIYVEALPDGTRCAVAWPYRGSSGIALDCDWSSRAGQNCDEVRAFAEDHRLRGQDQFAAGVELTQLNFMDCP